MLKCGAMYANQMGHKLEWLKQWWSHFEINRGALDSLKLQRKYFNEIFQEYKDIKIYTYEHILYSYVAFPIIVFKNLLFL